VALLPGKTELFDLAKDPGRGVLHDLGSRLLPLGKQQKPSLWIKAQPALVGLRARRSWIPTSTSMMATAPREAQFARDLSRQGAS